ncbi:uncharacterized protein LOC127452590 [Myxocyprinus asiaticus]|uniref:uncharacterized protein LOC127452590 n=1 Tax=Myxocyprinus asiaticus TaxID=70543 RepID=UPI002222792C|nr:uncharacterized protein LOC127452590 [Myxocyprinus asiaticus]
MKRRSVWSFHRLPFNSPKILKLWLVALSIDVNTPIWRLRKFDLRVCGAHFSEEDYLTESARKTELKRRCLKKSAVPNIIHHPEQYRVAEIFHPSYGHQNETGGLGPWSPVSLTPKRLQEDGDLFDGNDPSSFDLHIIQVKQEDSDESGFWCSGNMQHDSEKMSGGLDASQPVPLTLNELKSGNFYLGNVETSEVFAQTHSSKTYNPPAISSLHLKTEESIEELTINREDDINLCSTNITYLTNAANVLTFTTPNQVSSTTCRAASSASGLAMKSPCENCLVLAKVREELKVEITVLQKRICALLCTKNSQQLTLCSSHSDHDYGVSSELRTCQFSMDSQMPSAQEQNVSKEMHGLSAVSSLDLKTEQFIEELNSDCCDKLLKGFCRNCLGKSPSKARKNTTQKINHVRNFILHMAKGYPPMKTLLFLDNMDQINKWVESLQKANTTVTNIKHYILDVLAFLKFLDRTARPTSHLTRPSRKRIQRQLRQKLKDIITLTKSHKQDHKGSTLKLHVSRSRVQGCASLHVMMKACR